MFRVAAAFALTFSAFASTAFAGSDFDKFVDQITEGGNVFAPPVSVTDTAGLDSVYAKLGRVSGGVFEPKGTGLIVFEGQTWRTGSTRELSTSTSTVQVELSQLLPADGDEPPQAIFRFVDSGQIYSVYLASAPGLRPVGSAKPAGWLLGTNMLISPVSLPAGDLEFRVGNSIVHGNVVARSRSSGLVLVKLARAAGDAVTLAPANYGGRVVVCPLTKEPFEAPAGVLVQSPPPEIVGSLVLTESGEFIGMLGVQGLVKATALGITGGNMPGSKDVSARRADLVSNAATSLATM